MLVALHGVDVAKVGLERFGKPERYSARQVDGWARQYMASVSVPDSAVVALIEWLQGENSEARNAGFGEGKRRGMVFSSLCS